MLNLSEGQCESLVAGGRSTTLRRSRRRSPAGCTTDATAFRLSPPCSVGGLDCLSPTHTSYVRSGAARPVSRFSLSRVNADFPWSSAGTIEAPTTDTPTRPSALPAPAALLPLGTPPQSCAALATQQSPTSQTSAWTSNGSSRTVRDQPSPCPPEVQHFNVIERAACRDDGDIGLSGGYLTLTHLAP